MQRLIECPRVGEIKFLRDEPGTLAVTSCSRPAQEGILTRQTLASGNAIEVVGCGNWRLIDVFVGPLDERIQGPSRQGFFNRRDPFVPRNIFKFGEERAVIRCHHRPSSYIIGSQCGSL